MKKRYPILEFDPDRSAVINPEYSIKQVDFPNHAVACFFSEVINKYVENSEAQFLTAQRSEMGLHPIYKMIINGKSIAVFHPCVGGPLVAAMIEEVIALGCRNIIACGGAGVLDPSIDLGQILVPNSAIRDEGTSYHYLPPSREIQPTRLAFEAVINTLNRRGIEYKVGKTWTTDAVYRETEGKIALRRAEGCFSVEMEAATLFAIAKFRKINIAQILYAGDSVGSSKWDYREWNNQDKLRESMFWFACEACLSL